MKSTFSWLIRLYIGYTKYLSSVSNFTFFHTVILSGKVCYSYYLKSRVYKLPSKGNLYYKKIAVIFLSFVKRSYLMLFLFSHLLRKVFVTSAISLERLEVEYKNISFLLSHLYTLLGQWKGRYPLRWTYENLNTSILDKTI